MPNTLKCFLLTVFALFFLIGCSGGGVETLDGKWKSNDDAVMEFHAEISGDKIEIYLTTATDEGRNLYWSGNVPAKTPTSFVSIADKDRLDAVIFGSLDYTKRFDYEDGTLNFAFSILDHQSVITLDKV